MPKKTYVRWMGAFAGHHYHFSQALKYEVETLDERACEAVEDGHPSHIQTEWGVLIRPSSIFRSFNFDCWSFRDSEGRLHQGKSRHSANKPHTAQWHTESWCHGEAVVGIVLRGNNENEIKKSLLKNAIAGAEKYGLKLYFLTSAGEIKKYKR